MFFVVDPVIKFEVNPTYEQVAEGTSGAIPTNSGVVILLESDVTKETQDSTQPKKKAKKRRNNTPEVEVLPEGPSVRFPEYLNRPAPNDLAMLQLRKHVMISQINYYNASTRFFDKATNLIPHIKRLIADMPGGKVGAQSSQPADHVYAFPSNSQDSDCDV